MDELTEVKIRRKIYVLISRNPGLHTNRIAEILKISGQLADYHLIYLERNGIIKTVKEEGYRRYYIEGKIGIQDRQRLSLLRQEIPLKIVLFLLKNPYSQHKEILGYLDIAASTLTYHIQKLIKKDIISVQISYGEKKYIIKDKKEIIHLLMKYKPYSCIDTFEEVWLDFTWK